MYLKQGLGMKDIAIHLNAEGISITMFRKKKNGEPMKQNQVTSAGDQLYPKKSCLLWSLCRQSICV